MIDTTKLTEADRGRAVKFRKTTPGHLVNWTDKLAFVCFNGLSGQACDPAHLEFDDTKMKRGKHRAR